MGSTENLQGRRALCPHGTGITGFPKIEKYKKQVSRVILL